MANVALVLASGGSRGLAHIGAIEVLEEHGYTITSISGTSMGALVGGIYAAGGLDAYKEWMKSVDKMKVFSLMDFTLSTDGLMKGKKIIEELKTIVPDKNIEDLPIPFSAVATDIRHRKEVVFTSGSLYEAIRASISIPSVFRPHCIGDMVLIDGGVVNPIPLDRVVRTPGDILAAVDLNAPYAEKPKNKKTAVEAEEEKSFFHKYILRAKDDGEPGFFEKFLRRNEEDGEKNEDEGSLNYLSILNESSGLMVEKNSERSISLYHPDILVCIPKNAFSTMEFDKYEEIVAMGRDLTEKALSLIGKD